MHQEWYKQPITFWLSILFLGISVPILMVGCDSAGDGLGNVSSEFIGRSGCQNNPSTGEFGIADTQDEEECIVFSYAGMEMDISHFNCLLNCCPDPIAVTAELESRTIDIYIRGESGCHCICLFDLEYQVHNIPPGSYAVRIRGYGTIREFSVDLFEGQHGKKCF